MVSLHQFLDALRGAMGGQGIDAEQTDIVEYAADRPMIVVAGPGTGKTTTIVARALRMVFVDGYDPASIVLTTFTKKAAAQLRSRVLGWGFAVRDVLLTDAGDSPTNTALRQLDLNRFVTGTLDSLAEQVIERYGDLELGPPVVLDEFIANGVLLTEGLFNNRMWLDDDLVGFANWHTDRNINASYLVQLCRQYRDRFAHDMIDQDTFAAEGPEYAALVRVLDQYYAGLQEYGPQVTDFAGLEAQFFEQLSSGALNGFTSGLRALFVDEFQDTNVLQESIYYRLANEIGGAITVVGDDDQSLHRFRGGTVELFRDAGPRMREALGTNDPIEVKYLTTNYRAPRLLVDFTQDFAELDADFQPSRIANKPRVRPLDENIDGLPVIAMFRNDQDQLAMDLAELIGSLFNGDGFNIVLNGQRINISAGPSSQPGDCAYIAYSVREYQREYFGERNPRFPLLLRWGLQQLSPPIRSFNPRGQVLAMVPDIGRLCGLMLQCIDPEGTHTNSMTTLPREAARVFVRWRDAASVLRGQNPEPNNPSTLDDFVRSWQRRVSQTGVDWPRELPLLDLCYHLLTWIPPLQDDPERQIHLEVIARAITETSRLNRRYKSRIVFDGGIHEERSVKRAIRHIFAPIALGDIGINEDIIETFPRTAVNFLTVHQAKGLEFPVVIVDAGAHFKINHRSQRGLRFPEEIGDTYFIEDLTLQHGGLRDAHFGHWRDRAFDDLARLYYVAYSRTQSLLILVGLNSASPQRHIRNVALGWSRDGVSFWRHDQPYIEI